MNMETESTASEFLVEKRSAPAKFDNIWQTAFTKTLPKPNSALFIKHTHICVHAKWFNYVKKSITEYVKS